MNTYNEFCKQFGLFLERKKEQLSKKLSKEELDILRLELKEESGLSNFDHYQNEMIHEMRTSLYNYMLYHFFYKYYTFDNVQLHWEDSADRFEVNLGIIGFKKKLQKLNEKLDLNKASLNDLKMLMANYTISFLGNEFLVKDGILLQNIWQLFSFDHVLFSFSAYQNSPPYFNLLKCKEVDEAIGKRIKSKGPVFIIENYFISMGDVDIFQKGTCAVSTQLTLCEEEITLIYQKKIINSLPDCIESALACILEPKPTKPRNLKDIIFYIDDIIQTKVANDDIDLYKYSMCSIIAWKNGIDNMEQSPLETQYMNTFCTLNRNHSMDIAPLFRDLLIMIKTGPYENEMQIIMKTKNLAEFWFMIIEYIRQDQTKSTNLFFIFNLIYLAFARYFINEKGELHVDIEQRMIKMEDFFLKTLMQFYQKSRKYLEELEYRLPDGHYSFKEIQEKIIYKKTAKESTEQEIDEKLFWNFNLRIRELIDNLKEFMPLEYHKYRQWSLKEQNQILKDFYQFLYEEDCPTPEKNVPCPMIILENTNLIDFFTAWKPFKKKIIEQFGALPFKEGPSE